MGLRLLFKRNKSYRERQIPYNLTYMWNKTHAYTHKTAHSYREETDSCQMLDVRGG